MQTPKTFPMSPMGRTYPLCMFYPASRWVISIHWKITIKVQILLRWKFSSRWRCMIKNAQKVRPTLPQNSFRWPLATFCRAVASWVKKKTKKKQSSRPTPVCDLDFHAGKPKKWAYWQCEVHIGRLFRNTLIWKAHYWYYWLKAIFQTSSTFMIEAGTCYISAYDDLN